MAIIADVTMIGGELYDIGLCAYKDENTDDIGIPYIRHYDKNYKLITVKYFRGYEFTAQPCIDYIASCGNIKHINWRDTEYEIII